MATMLRDGFKQALRVQGCCRYLADSSETPWVYIKRGKSIRKITFPYYHHAIQACQNGIADVQNEPARPGEAVFKIKRKRPFPKEDEHLLARKAGARRSLFQHPIRPNPYSNLDLPRERAKLSIGTVVNPFLPHLYKYPRPGDLFTEKGREKYRKLFQRLLGRVGTAYYFWRFISGRKKDFLIEATQLYILAQQAGRDNDKELLKEVVCESYYPVMKRKWNYTRRLWRCHEIVEQPKIVNRFATPLEPGGFSVAQVTVHLKTKEERACYDKYGTLIVGKEGEHVDVDQYIVFERALRDSRMKQWRILDIVNAETADRWQKLKAKYSVAM